MVQKIEKDGKMEQVQKDEKDGLVKKVEESQKVQIYAKVDGMKTVVTEMSPKDEVQKILTVSGGDWHVYATCEGRIPRKDDEMESCGVRDGSTVQVKSRMRGGGRHKDKKSKVEKRQVTIQEPMTHEDPAILESDKDAVIRMLEETEEYRKIVEDVSRGSDVEVERKMQYWVTALQARAEVDTGQMRVMECGLRWAVEARSKGRQQGEEQRRQQEEKQRRHDEQEQSGQQEAGNGDRRSTDKCDRQNSEQEQSKQVRFGQEDQVKETRAESTDEPEVTDGLAEVRTGPGSAGLVRGRDERCHTDETSRKGKGKGNGRKSEHGSKGGARSKGTQQVENSVTDEDQGNMRAMQSEEEEEDHRKDVRKLVEMMRKEEAEREEAADGVQQHSKETGEGEKADKKKREGSEG